MVRIRFSPSIRDWSKLLPYYVWSVNAPVKKSSFVFITHRDISHAINSIVLVFVDEIV